MEKSNFAATVFEIVVLAIAVPVILGENRKVSCNIVSDPSLEPGLVGMTVHQGDDIFVACNGGYVSQVQGSSIVECVKGEWQVPEGTCVKPESVGVISKLKGMMLGPKGMVTRNPLTNPQELLKNPKDTNSPPMLKYRPLMMQHTGVNQPAGWLQHPGAINKPAGWLQHPGAINQQGRAVPSLMSQNNQELLEQQLKRQFLSEVEALVNKINNDPAHAKKIYVKGIRNLKARKQNIGKQIFETAKIMLKPAREILYQNEVKKFVDLIQKKKIVQSSEDFAKGMEHLNGFEDVSKDTIRQGQESIAAQLQQNIGVEMTSNNRSGFRGLIKKVVVFRAQRKKALDSTLVKKTDKLAVIPEEPFGTSSDTSSTIL